MLLGLSLKLSRQGQHRSVVFHLSTIVLIDLQGIQKS